MYLFQISKCFGREMYQLDLPCVGWHDYGTLLQLFYSFDYDLIFYIIKKPERTMQKARADNVKSPSGLRVHSGKTDSPLRVFI